MNVPRPLTICRIQSRICIGGPSHHSLILSQGLSPGYRTILVGGAVDAGEYDLEAQARAAGIETLIVPAMRRRPGLKSDLAAFFALWRLFRRERPVIVDTHTAKAGVLGRLAARLAGVPVVVHTFHGHVFEGYFGPCVARAIIFVERMLARISDAIVVISPTQYDDIACRFRVAPPPKVHMIPLGLELDRFAALAEAGAAPVGTLRRELHCPPEALLVGIVGRLVPIKNHSLFVEAAARLCAELPGRDLHFVVIGDGERRQAIEEEARRAGLDPRFHLVGWRLDMAPVLADLDLLVSTSRNEGTPAAMIEAMAAGIPVVATAVGGVRDLLRGYPQGRLVTTFDPEDVAAAMADLLRGTRVRASHGVERFGARRLVRDMETLYTRLLRLKGIEPPIAIEPTIEVEPAAESEAAELAA